MGVENLFKEMLQNILTLTTWQFQISVTGCIFILCNCVRYWKSSACLSEAQKKVFANSSTFKAVWSVLCKNKSQGVLQGEISSCVDQLLEFPSSLESLSFSFPELLYCHSFLPAVLRELCFFYFQCLIFDGRRRFSSRHEVFFSHLLIIFFP